MIRPPSPACRMCSTASRTVVKVPRRCTLITVSKSSSLIFHSTVSRSTPALVTRMSSRPNSSTAAVTSCFAVSVGPTGAVTATARPPEAWIAATASAVTAASTSLTTTDAPRRANSLA